MRGFHRTAIERDLGALYRSDRAGQKAPQGALDACSAVCADACEAQARTERSAKASRLRAMAFMGSQVRNVRVGTWVAFGLVALLAAAGCAVGEGMAAVPQTLSAAGALLSLVCLADVTRAKSFGMAELEGACAFNAVSVVLARLLLMGGTSVLVLVVAALASGMQGAGIVQALMWMGAPYLVSCAGGLMCARRVQSPDARSAAIAWASGVVAIAATLYFVAPSAYAPMAAGVWGLAWAGACAWCIAEVRAWISASADCFVLEPRVQRI